MKNYFFPLLLIHLSFFSVQAQNSAQSFTEANNQFAFDFFKTVADTNRNIVFSPFSVSSCLGMSLMGASGETRRQMEALLHLQSSKKLNKWYYNENFVLLNNTPTMMVANAAWVEQTYPFTEAYKDMIAYDFFGKVKNADFAGNPEFHRIEINKWVEEKTKKNIPEIIPPNALNNDTRLVLANAIYFKDSWRNSFDSTKTNMETFYTPSGPVSAKFMTKTENLKVYEKKEMRMIVLPYKHSGDIKMYVVVPKEGKQLADITKYMNDEYLMSDFENFGTYNVTLSMPKFTTEYGGSIKNILKKMGMIDAFDVRLADFSVMDPGKATSVSEIFHKAKIVVNEEGTEASAATVIMGVERSMPPEPLTFVVDRSFIFMIRSGQTILFMGQILDPNKE